MKILGATAPWVIPTGPERRRSRTAAPVRLASRPWGISGRSAWCPPRRGAGNGTIGGPAGVPRPGPVGGGSGDRGCAPPLGAHAGAVVGRARRRDDRSERGRQRHGARARGVPLPRPGVPGQPQIRRNRGSRLLPKSHGAARGARPRRPRDRQRGARGAGRRGDRAGRRWARHPRERRAAERHTGRLAATADPLDGRACRPADRRRELHGVLQRRALVPGVPVQPAL
jgi:hypothetical protein